MRSEGNRFNGGFVMDSSLDVRLRVAHAVSTYLEPPLIDTDEQSSVGEEHCPPNPVRLIASVMFLSFLQRCGFVVLSLCSKTSGGSGLQISGRR
jgi:hypothetical protein